ncbi:MAG TPA: energy transducer TonB [Acidobacteriaceae bacterium]|nr:energy transducer TonB [Acidobacteriaceae bacterium]
MEVKYLRTGSLHIIDASPDALDRKVIWLCDSCSQRFVVEPWRQPGQQLQQRLKWTVPGSVRIRSAKESAELAKSFAAHELDDFSSAYTIFVGSTDLRILKQVSPLYPPIAKADHISGRVDLQISLGPDGHVTAASVISGPSLFIAAAEHCVKQWVYEPFVSHGRTCAVSTVVTVNFDSISPENGKDQPTGTPVLLLQQREIEEGQHVPTAGGTRP